LPDGNIDVTFSIADITLSCLSLNANSSCVIDGDFATFERERLDALFVAPSGFFTSRRVIFRTKLEVADMCWRICSASSASEHAPPGPGRRPLEFGGISLRER
jgi:hypothetical protein